MIKKQNQNQTAILFLGGSDFFEKKSLVADHIKKLQKKNFTVIAADKGAEFALKSGFTPTVVIGDCDSISDTAKAELLRLKIPFALFPTDKDQTDSELALAYIFNHKFRHVICFGLEGDRSDHFLANMLLFSLYVKKGVTIEAIGTHCCYYFSTQRIVIEGKVGDTLTLLSLTLQTTEINSNGLKYRLKNQILKQGTSLGVSNIFVKKNITVTFQKGVLLAIHTALH